MKILRDKCNEIINNKIMMIIFSTIIMIESFLRYEFFSKIVLTIIYALFIIINVVGIIANIRDKKLIEVVEIMNQNRGE